MGAELAEVTGKSFHRMHLFLMALKVELYAKTFCANLKKNIFLFELQTTKENSANLTQVRKSKLVILDALFDSEHRSLMLVACLANYFP